MREVIYLAAGLALYAPAAMAHDTDCNGKSQPAVILSGCCGKEDYLALKSDEVRADGQGWDVFIDGAWRQAVHSDGDGKMVWLIAQPTLSACWGVWYRRGHREGAMVYYNDHGGHSTDVDDYVFYCLEQPATE